MGTDDVYPGAVLDYSYMPNCGPGMYAAGVVEFGPDLLAGASWRLIGMGSSARQTSPAVQEVRERGEAMIGSGLYAAVALLSIQVTFGGGGPDGAERQSSTVVVTDLWADPRLTRDGATTTFPGSSSLRDAVNVLVAGIAGDDK